jgi:ribosomal protein S18 acetylase RimI-like enzyme
MINQKKGGGLKKMKIELIEDRAELKHVMDGVFSEEHRERGVDGKIRLFAYAVKDDNGNILGGITGRRMFDEIHVNDICLDKRIRGQGFGKKLLEIVEKEIDDGGCENINLSTIDFQGAVGFYEKRGFEVEFVRKRRNNGKLDRYYMVKKLRNL